MFAVSKQVFAAVLKVNKKLDGNFYKFLLADILY